jgi:hypothetical protein
LLRKRRRDYHAYARKHQQYPHHGLHISSFNMVVLYEKR